MKKLLLLLIGFAFLVNLNAQTLDSLKHEHYLQYTRSNTEAGLGVVSEAKWNEIHAAEYKYEDYFPTAPGTYLVKAQRQIIGGFVLSAMSLTGIVVNSAANSEGDSYKAINYAMGGLSLVALILEINGVVNIGKAGVALNDNGVGIKVTF